MEILSGEMHELFEAFELEPEEWNEILSIAEDRYMLISPEILYYVAVEYILDREELDKEDFMIDYQDFATYALHWFEPGSFYLLTHMIPNLHYYA